MTSRTDISNGENDVTEQIRGALTGATDFTGFRLSAEFQVLVEDLSTTTNARVIADVAPDGAVVLDLPAREQRPGPATLTVLSPAGIGLERVTFDELSEGFTIEVRNIPEPISVGASGDPALGRPVVYSGRVLDPAGAGAPAELLVVLWGAPTDGDADDATPLDVATTSAGGYFYGPWSSDVHGRAFATVAGSEPVEIQLDDDGRLPTRFAVVLPEAPVPPAHEEDDCSCEAPPRAPDALQLAENGAAFSADAGRCVDFTVPNRTLEEVTYQAVVRTTQPSLRGTPQFRPAQLPTSIRDRLFDLAKGAVAQIPEEPPIDVAPRAITRDLSTMASLTGPGAPPRLLAPRSLTNVLGSPDLASVTLAKAQTFFGGVDLETNMAAEPDITPARVADTVIDSGSFERDDLRLETGALAELTREPGSLTPLRLLTANLSSAVRRFRGAVEQLAAPNPARFELDESRQVEWDDLPLPYQATTIAHGHLLTLKQVWKADGYSLGDLLYSLPLAPGQQKLVSVVDWDRRETTRRDARRTATEDVVASLTHDRDISDIISSTLREQLDGRSSADVSAVGGGLGAFIGPLVIGAAGGVSTAGSTASQTSGRQVSGSALNQVRDRTMQAASSVRGQRASVVQTAQQGESVRATTEVVANYNHCHAMTVEYFEVLRHLQVSQEVHQVQECLFVPFAITPFSQSKALRWRDSLEPSVRRPALRGAFDALARVASGWQDADVPARTYAEEPLRHLEGQVSLRMSLPRPADAADSFNATAWAPYAPWLGGMSAQDVFDRYLGNAAPAERNGLWNRHLAPVIAQRIVNKLTVELVVTVGATRTVSTDATLVSSFRHDWPMTVGLRIEASSLTGTTRQEVQAVRIKAPADTPPHARMSVDTGTFRYRTDHLAHTLVANQRFNNDLAVGDHVDMLAPLSRVERRNPRELDQRLADELLDHLDEHIEHFHRAIWMRMDPNRRYLLLDGFVAPDAGGRSVATVVENRVVGVVGNCLVMPLRPGVQLDPTYEFADAEAADLRHLYAGGSAPPMRISLPTRGVFAEAVLGKCNSCEVIDDSRFWRFEEEPIPDRPTSIEASSTETRRREAPSLAPDLFPQDALVKMQTVPNAPDPTGLTAAMKTLGTAGLFRNVTGLALNQANSAQALKTAITTAQAFATQAGALAQQRYMSRELDRSIERIKQARDKKLISPEEAQGLTESAVRGALGLKRPDSESATKDKAVADVIERASTAEKGSSVRVTRPEGTVEVKTGDQVETSKKAEGSGKAGKPRIDVDIDPPLDPIAQKTSNVCWAAAATMMRSWKMQASTTVETAMDALGSPWRTRYNNDTALSVQQLRQLTGALSLHEEGPASYRPEGIADLLRNHGPLWVITDDEFGTGNKLVHARIVTGIHGDGTPDATSVRIADSADGTIGTETFTEFAARLEAQEAVVFGVGIFHF